MTGIVQPGQAVKTDVRKRITISESTVKWVLIAAIAVVMIAHLLTLTNYPPVFIDEGWIANASWTWLTTGVNFDAMHIGTLDQLENPWIWRYFLGQAPYAASYAIFGLGLFQTRLVSWVFGGVLLIATAGVSRRLYGSITGWLAALLLALSFSFTISSRWRQDIILAAVIMLAFWLVLIAIQENRFWAHFVAALMITLGLDVHQNATMFMPAWAILYVVFYGRRVFVERGTWLAAAGGALGLAMYAVLHILPAPETFSTLMSLQVNSTGAAHPPILNPVSLLRSLVMEGGRYFRLSNLEELFIVAGGYLFLALRRTKADYILLVFLAAVFATFTLFSAQKWDIYAILLYPFMVIPAAEALVSLQRRRSTGRMYHKYAAIAAGTIFAVFIVAKVMWFGQIANVYRTHDYYAITNQLRSPMPDDARVMGMPQWWFGFSDMDFRSSYNVTYYRALNGYNTEESLRAIQPNYVIVDEFWRILLLNDPSENLMAGNSWVPRQEFWDVLDERGTLILEIDYPWMRGTVQLYEMSWS